MLHFIEITIYVVLSAALILKATQRPIWGVAYYMLNFFAQPNYWEWGNPLNHPGILRWSLYSALFLVVVVLIQPSKIRFKSDRDMSRTTLLLILLLANAGLVHVAFAYNRTISWEVLNLLLKYSLFYYLTLQCIRSPRDFILLLTFFALGLGYWGFEGKFVGVTLISGRLERFGGPGCSNSNELASITATLLPMIGGLLFLVKGMWRVFLVFTTALSLNILMLCNSRGGFIGLITAAFTLPILTTGKVRRLAINSLLAGAVATLLLAGNPQIMSRFITTFFADSEARGQAMLDEMNKESRLIFWGAATQMLIDHPLGSGGNGFKAGKGNPYLAAAGVPDRFRSCHQGYLEEAMSWGIQGLLLRLGFLVSAGLAALKASRFRARIGDTNVSFAGVCILGGFSAMLVTSMFGDFLQMEWGFWLVITAVAYAKVYGEANYGIIPETLFSAQDAANSQAAAPQFPAPAGVS